MIVGDRLVQKQLKLMSLYLFLFLNFSFFQTVYAEARHRGGAELLNPKAYSMALGLSRFQTNSYFDQDGAEVTMVEGNDYSFIDLDFKLVYGVSPNLEVTGFGKMRSVSSTLNNTSTSKTGAESLGVEGKYSFEPIGATQYALGLHYRQTLYTNAVYTSISQIPIDEVALGDSGSEYGVHFYLTHNPKPFKWDAKVGYVSPPNNLSAEINYHFELLYQLDRFSVFGGFEGIYSLGSDEFESTPNLKPIQAKGATTLWNSINREKFIPFVGFNYAFDKIFFTAKAATVMRGVYTDQGTEFSGMISFDSEGVTPESKKIASFKEYSVDGSVLKVSARGNFVRIDQGLSTDVEKGMKFDIYQTDYFGGNVLVASGLVYEVGADWSIIKVVKRYNEIVIKPGFAARGY